MKRRFTTGLAIVLGLVIAGVTLQLLRPGEARYDGKPARFWVREMIEKPDSTFSPETAEVARLRRIGTPAVECLKDAIERERYLAGTSVYSNLYPHLPATLARRLPRPVDPTLVHIRAYWALAALGPLAKPAAPLLAERVVDPNNRLRSFSTYALGKIGTNALEVAPVLVSGLSQTNREVWSAAGEVLMRMDSTNEAALKKLGGELKSADVVSRRMAAYALGESNPLSLQAERLLLANLGDEDLWVRFRAAMALFKRYPTDQNYMEALLEIDQSPKATSGMLFDVAQIRPATRETTRLMVESYKLHAGPGRSNSYYDQFFGEFSARDSNAVPALVAALGDARYPRLRGLAARALGLIGPPAAAAGPALRQAAADENREVRSQASRALEQTLR